MKQTFFLFFIFISFYARGQINKTLKIEFNETIFGLPKIDSLNPFFMLEIDETKNVDTILVKKDAFNMKFVILSKQLIHCVFESKSITAEGDFFILPQPLIDYVYTYDFINDRNIIRKVINYYLVIRQGKWKFVREGETTFQNNNFELRD